MALNSLHRNKLCEQNTIGTVTRISGDLMKLESFCMAKDTVFRTEQHPTDGEKFFIKYTFSRGLISKLYKELKSLDVNKSQLTVGYRSK